MKKYKLMFSFIILIFLFSKSMININNNEGPKIDVDSEIKTQVNLANNWRSGEKLPDFFFKYKYSQKLYKELYEYGGFIKIAIIENITNKPLLLELLSDCNKSLDVIFEDELNKDESWDYSTSYFNYFKMLTIRDVIKYRYWKLNSFKQLSDDLKSYNMEEKNCAQETLWYFKGLKSPQNIDRKYLKGFILKIGTTKGGTTSIIFSNEKNLPESSETPEDLSNSIYDIIENEVKASKYNLDYSFVEKLKEQINSKYRQNNLIYKYTAPYFESNLSSQIDKKILSEFTHNKNKLPYYKIDKISGFVVLLYIEKVW